MAFDYIDFVLEKIKTEFIESGYPETHEKFSVDEIFVEMRDGINLQTFIYKPESSIEKYSVILQRTCYPSSDKFYKVYGENLARRGYIYIYQYCRGNSQSEGTWSPNENEEEDGLDTVDWVWKQDFTENIGYWGCSYLALTGWAFGENVTSMCLEHYGTDRFVSAYEKGSFRQDVLTSWTMENAGFDINADFIESCKYMPQIEVDEKLWGQKIEWYRDYLENTRIEDEYWHKGFWKHLREMPTKVKIPLYIVSGWFDHHHGSTMKTWERLSKESKSHSWLEIGGWNHFFINAMDETKSAKNLDNNEMKKMLNWFDLTLKQKKIPEPKVNYYVIGKDQWVETKTWEDENTLESCLYFGGDKSLNSESKPTTDYFTYEYNPKNPIPSLGGEALLKSNMEIGGMRLQPEPDWRQDVLSFISDKLERPMFILGKMNIELFVRSDCEDTAFTAKIMEENEDGKAYNIRSSISTLSYDLGREYIPGEIVKISIDFWDIAYEIKKGSKIRIDISSSDFPGYNIHSNNAGNWAKQSTTKIAIQNIFIGVEYPSKITLPLKSTII